MTPCVEIAVECDDWTVLDDLQGLADTAIGAAIAGSNADVMADAEVSVVFCDDAFIARLNEKWRGLAKATNVLSFPSGMPLPEAAILGDIVVAFETTQREALQDGKTLHDHVMHLLVHGTLHLLGFDHEVEPEAEAMESLERAVLADLGIGDPYAGAAILAAERS